MSDFNLVRREAEKATILEFAGQLDEHNLEEASSKIEEMIFAEGKTNFVLNLKNLNFINSKVIGYLVDLHGRMSEKGKNLTLAEANENVADVLDLVGLPNLVPHFQKEAAALESFSKKEEA